MNGEILATAVRLAEEEQGYEKENAITHLHKEEGKTAHYWGQRLRLPLVTRLHVLVRVNISSGHSDYVSR